MNITEQTTLDFLNTNTNARNVLIVKAAKDGWTTRQIANTTKLSLRRVQEIVKAANQTTNAIL